MHCDKHDLKYGDREAICPICKAEESVRCLLAVINVAADRIRKSLYMDAELLLRRAEQDVRDGVYNAFPVVPDAGEEPPLTEFDNSDEPEAGDEVEGIWEDDWGQKGPVRGPLLGYGPVISGVAFILDATDPSVPWTVDRATLKVIKKARN
jgi:hypothetical protein